jgi:hypothetical protein
MGHVVLNFFQKLRLAAENPFFNKIVVEAGGSFLSVTRAGPAWVVYFKNNFS